MTALPRRLILQAVEQEEVLGDDGKRLAQRVGAYLQQRGCMPDAAVAAPGAAETAAAKALKAGGGNTGGLARSPELLDGPASAAGPLAVLSFAPSPARVLVAAPRPVLDRMVRALGGEPVAAPLVLVELPADWTRLGVSSSPAVEPVFDPDLPRAFPFLAPGGPEFRDRPAYYYRQSSVIPFRRKTAGAEFLVIRSSKRKHWVVPKGIVEPGLDPRLSAAKEAREEAGVEGDIWPEPVGSYRFRKWGAECQCQVFAMGVTRILAPDLWRERHRGREWLPAAEAAARLKNRDLAALARRLAARL